MKGSNMQNYDRDIQSADYLYMVCRQNPLLVISTESGVGKYKFSCIGFKHSRMLLEFTLMIDVEFEDSQTIHEDIGDKYYLTIDQYLNVYKKSACA